MCQRLCVPTVLQRHGLARPSDSQRQPHPAFQLLRFLSASTPSDPTWPPHPLPPSRRARASVSSLSSTAPLAASVLPAVALQRSGDPPSPRQLRRRRRPSVPSRFIAPPRGPSFRSTIYSSPSARVLLSRSGGSSHGPAILRLPTSQWSGCFNQSHAPAAAGTARQSRGCPRLRGADALVSQVLPYSQI